VNQRTHEQSRWELVSIALVVIVVAAVGSVLIHWALTAPVTTPRELMPQVAVTEYAEES
jgi:hypothetical protein